jgi:hypothetical protein
LLSTLGGEKSPETEIGTDVIPYEHLSSAGISTQGDGSMSKGFNRSIGVGHGSQEITASSVNHNQATGSAVTGWGAPKRTFGHNAQKPKPDTPSAGAPFGGRIKMGTLKK